MLKIKIYELNKHRNETTFRPYIMAQNLLRDIGIEFVNGDTYDIAWVGQASIADKLLPLEESVSKGIEFCESISGDYIIFDGQDSHSLMGTYEVYKQMKMSSNGRCLLLMKNTLLKDFDMYLRPTVNGRWYWGDGEYSIPDIHEYKDDIALSGTNWLSTVDKVFYDMDYFDKQHDVCALFGYPLTSGHEHGLQHHKHYNSHRKPCVDTLKNISGLDIQMLSDGQRVHVQEYYKRMACSKIVINPFGFGEMAPRDIETMAFGSILLKPTVDYLTSEPWIYDEGNAYIGCRHDYSDLEEKIDFILTNFESLRKEMYEYTREKYQKMYVDKTRLPIYLHDLFSNRLKETVKHENT